MVVQALEEYGNPKAAGTSDSFMDESDQKLVRKIKDITSKGNDAEVRRKRDGTLAVYEVRKNAV